MLNIVHVHRHRKLQLTHEMLHIIRTTLCICMFAIMHDIVHKCATCYNVLV